MSIMDDLGIGAGSPDFDKEFNKPSQPQSDEDRIEKLNADLNRLSVWCAELQKRIEDLERVKPWVAGHSEADDCVNPRIVKELRKHD